MHSQELCCSGGGAYASDPTALFVMLIGIPSIVVSIIFLFISLISGKVGIVLSGIGFLATILIMAWASNVGYMESSGYLFLISMSINAFAIGISVKRMKNQHEDNK